jgi:hypothetical protein
MEAKQLLAIAVAASFAAGLNVYATTATLGLLARFGVVALPPELSVLSSSWVIGISLAMFAVEFLADKIPIFDLFWNVLQTFVRVPVGALLAWSAATPLSPAAQLLAAASGGAIALVAHGGKLAMRSAVTASPEPLSNIVLSLVEDVVAIGLTWVATSHPYVAITLAVVLLATAAALIWGIWIALGRSARALRRWFLSANQPLTGGPP